MGPMTKEEGHPLDDEMGFLWDDNHSWGLSNSDDDNSPEPEPEPELEAETKDMKQQQEKLEGRRKNELGGEGQSKKRRSPAGKNKKSIRGGDRKDGKCLRESDHETHIMTERQRRKKMRNMFASLHALLPQLPSKADKSTVVDEAVNYIKNLQQTVEKLEKQKQERLQKSASTFGYEPSSVINSQWHPYDSREAFIAGHAPSSSNNFGTASNNPSSSLSVPLNLKPVAFETWTSSSVVLNICGVDQAQFCICSPRKQGILTTVAFVLEKHKIEVITASILCNANGNQYMIQARANRGPHQFPEANSAEKSFRQAAGEIMLWLS